MGDSHLVGDAQCGRTGGGNFVAVGSFPFKAGWLAAWLALTMAAGCSRQECPDRAAPAIQGSPQGVRPVSSDPELQDFLARHKEATIRMLNGDVSSWMELASHSDEATLFPPFGGVERGWAQVGARYEYAVARNRERRKAGAALDIELVSSGVSGDLAYVVTLERGQARTGGGQELGSWLTRVTHVLRREQDGWVLVHRHMDHLPEMFTPPGQ